ncbi:MAG: type II toxin-antitoxin system RelE/ParE family toxin [Terriglobia bacterium]
MPDLAYNTPALKPVHFLGTAREDLRTLGEDVRETIGFQLYKLQQGLLPDDWKPMPGLGVGVNELRAREEGKAYRVIYVAKFAEAIYVLHVFAKKARKAPRHDVAIARQRYQQLMQWRKVSIP